MFVSAAVVASWWLVGHNSGDGWVQVLGDIVFAVLLVAVCGPVLALRRARVSVEAAPLDAAAGRVAVIRIAASAPVRVRPIEPPGPARMVGPGPATLDLAPGGRGVHSAVRVEIASAAPFGIQWWAHTESLALPHELHVAPRRGPAEDGRLATTTGDDRAAPTVARAASRPGRDQTGDLRRPRPYVRGDNRRHVHWPASAHAGRLMVREPETPPGPPAELIVVLPPDPDRAERAAESAYGRLLDLLEEGRQVLLVTDEPAGTVRSEVADPVQAGRRLARAVTPRRPGEPGAGP